MESLPIIQTVWKALDYPCAERLHPMLLETAELLSLHGHFTLSPLLRSQLSDISRSTLGRRLTKWLSQKPKGTTTRSAKSFSRLLFGNPRPALRVGCETSRGTRN